jgi:hypothetical protein
MRVVANFYCIVNEYSVSLWKQIERHPDLE